MMWGSFGLAISMMLIAVLLSFTPDRGYSAKLNKATSSASVAFFFTYVSFSILDVRRKDTDHLPDVHLRRISELHSMVRPMATPLIATKEVDIFQGIRTRNSSSARQSKGHSHRHLLKLALGKLLHRHHSCKIMH
jgi:hypothetical protein